MPTYNEDNRVEWSYRTTQYDRYGKLFVDRIYRGTHGNGVVKHFSGPNEGRFTPGVYRVNSMTASRTSYAYGSGGFKFELPGGGYGTVTGTWTKRLQPKFSFKNDWDDSLMGYAVQRAYGQLLSSDMDMGEFLAELPQTISMVRGGVTSILKAIASASRGGFTWEKANRARLALLSGSSLKRLPKRVADSWLTWRYGIRPLIWDVQDLIREANNFALQSNWSKLQRKRGRVSKSSTQEFEYSATIYNVFQGKAKEYVEVQRKGEAVVYYRYGANWGPIQFILLKYGLHPNQLPYLLWQLRPLSFMLDWFVDVGTWVKAITPKWGIEILGCSASQKTILTSTRTCRAETSSPGARCSDTITTDTFRAEGINRRPQTLSGEIPRLRPSIILSIQQQADILSVLLQRALNHRRH